MSCRILNIKSPADAEAVELFRRLAERGNPADGNGEDVEKQVRAILADVRARGDQALLDRTRQFDAPDLQPPFAVPQEELARAAASGCAIIMSCHHALEVLEPTCVLKLENGALEQLDGNVATSDTFWKSV